MVKLHHIVEWILAVSKIIIVLVAAVYALLIAIVLRILLLPFPVWMGQRCVDYLAGFFHTLAVLSVTGGAQVYMDGDYKEIMEINKKKSDSVLLMSNHLSAADWTIHGILAILVNTLNHYRAFMKQSLLWVPYLGFMCYLDSYITVDRSHFSVNKLIKALKYLNQPNIPSWIVIYPEGTRHDIKNTRLIAKSKDAAHSLGFEPLEYHLTPRSRGAWLVIEEMRDKMDAIHDVTLAWDDCIDENGCRKPAPHMIDMLKGRPVNWYVHMKRIPISDVPTEELKFQQWMHERFIEKDKIVSAFYSTDPKVREEAWSKSNRVELTWASILPSILILYFFPACVLLLGGFALHLKISVLLLLGTYGWLVLLRVK